MEIYGARRKLGCAAADNVFNSCSAHQLGPGALDALITLNMQDDIMEHCYLYTDEAERYLSL